MTGLSPQRWLLLATLAYGLLATAATLTVLGTPWLGIRFEPESRTGGLKVGELHARGPAAGELLPGEQVYWIAGGDLPPFPLIAADLLEDPDHAPDYAGYREFLERQTEIFARLRQPEVILGLSEDRRLVLRPVPTRPSGSLPPVFWFQLLCAMAGFLVAAGVWAFRSRNTAVRFFAVAGAGLMITLLPTTPYVSRELALDGSLIRGLSVANHFGGVLFVAGLVGVAWNYPARLARFPADLVAAAALLLIWLLDTAQLFGSVSRAYWYPMLGVGLASAGFIARQWRLSRGNPAARAIVNWLLLAAIFGPGLYIALFLVPLLFGHEPLVSQSASWGFLTLFFMMMALGVARYRMFELERVWFRAWGWFLGGLSVILLDILLVYLLGIGGQLALLLSLVIVGFVYFPLRQRIWGLFPWQRHEQNLLELLPYLLGLALEAGDDTTESKWLLALYRVFEPLEMRALNEPVKETGLFQEGLVLRIPGFEGCVAVELYCAQRGGRLFSPRDVEFASALRLLFERATASRKALYQGAYIERSRIARDLHDDLGPMLLSMIYRASVPEVSDMARDALAKLRTVIHSLEARDRLLSEVLPEWRREAKERCDDARIELRWREAELPRDPLLNVRQQINLQRVMQEAISNMIKHSGARYAEVLFSLDDENLRISVSDDGAGFGEKNSPGSGMNNMRRRIQELGGAIQWQAPATGGCRVDWNVPLPPETAKS